MTELMLKNIIVNKNVMKDDKYKYIFSVDEVNRKVMEGIPFRDAYKGVSKLISEGKTIANKEIKYTNEGSIDNLCNNKITEKMQDIYLNFNFAKPESAIKNLFLDDDLSK